MGCCSQYRYCVGAHIANMLCPWVASCKGCYGAWALEMHRLATLLKQPKFWLGVTWILLPINIVSVWWYTSVPAILALCVNVGIITAPLYWRLRQ